MIAKLDFKRDVAPFLIATFGEFTALILWYKYQGEGNAMAARVALWSGFAVERIAVSAWLRYVWAPAMGMASGPIWRTAIFLFVITLAEVGIWGLWLSTSTGMGLVAGGAVLFVLIHALHALEMGAARGENPLVYTTNQRTLLYSVMETTGGVLWLTLTLAGQPLFGALALLAGLSVEHVVQGALLKPADVPAPAPIRA